jgi:amino-acid N-acetyltransferase
MNAVGSIRLQIEALLSMGLANSPMYGARIDVVSGNFVTAKPYGIRDGVDFQLTGEVRTVDTDAIQRHLDNHNIVCSGQLAIPPQAKCSTYWQKKWRPAQRFILKRTN